MTAHAAFLMLFCSVLVAICPRRCMQVVDHINKKRSRFTVEPLYVGYHQAVSQMRGIPFPDPHLLHYHTSSAVSALPVSAAATLSRLAQQQMREGPGSNCELRGIDGATVHGVVLCCAVLCCAVRLGPAGV